MLEMEADNQDLEIYNHIFINQYILVRSPKNIKISQKTFKFRNKNIFS